MIDVADLTIAVELEFDDAIALLAEETRLAPLREQLTTSLREFLATLGIDGAPCITVQRLGWGNRVMQVRVQGLRQPFAPETMRRIWQSRPSAHQEDLPDQPSPGYEFPDQWLREYLERVDPAHQEEVTHALTYLADLVLAVIQERPSCLIGEAQVRAYTQRAPQPFEGKLDPVAFVLKFLVDHGVSVANVPLILQAISQGEALARPFEDTAETLFARLRSPQLDIIVSPQDFSSLAGADAPQETASVYSEMVRKGSREPFSLMEDEMFWEMGLYCPDFTWKIDPGMPGEMVAFRLNNRATSRLPLLPLGYILVNATPERLRLLGVTATPTRDPANGNLCSIVPVAHQQVLEDMGLTTLTPLGYLLLLLADEIRRQSANLFTVADAAYHLAQIRDAYPMLVEHITQRFSLEDLTRVLRALLAEGISIRDLRSLLERLLQYDTIPVDASKHIVFDERLPVTPGGHVIHSDSWKGYYEFVRSGLKRYLSYSLLRSQSTLVVYLLDPELEQWLVTDHLAWYGNAQELDDKRHAIREAVWGEMASSVTSKPIILTSMEPRQALRDILSLEMPDVRVIAFTELATDVNIQPLARIYFPT
jgi:flagellar biosynthesis component FlhA